MNVISGFSFIGSAILSATSMGKNTQPAQPKPESAAVENKTDIAQDSGNVQTPPRKSDFLA